MQAAIIIKDPTILNQLKTKLLTYFSNYHIDSYLNEKDFDSNKHYDILFLDEQSVSLAFILDCKVLFYLISQKKEHFYPFIDRDTLSLNTYAIAIKSRYDHHYIEIHTIAYIQSYYHQIYIHTRKHTYIAKQKTLLYYQTLLPGFFIKISQSTFVNLLYIQALNNEEIILRDGTSLSISKSYKKEVYFLYHMKKRLFS